MRINGTGEDGVALVGVHKMPGNSSRMNLRSRRPSLRSCSAVRCMVVPFGGAQERRPRTTYRPAATPTESAHVDMFTGATSSSVGPASESYQRSSATPTGFLLVARTPLSTAGQFLAIRKHDVLHHLTAYSADAQG